MNKNLEEFKKICSDKTKEQSPVNVRRERSLIKTLEDFENRIKKLEGARHLKERERSYKQKSSKDYLQEAEDDYENKI